MQNLDKRDLQILFELDKNARIAETQLAKKIGRSKESVRYRIKQLEKNGVLKRYTIWIDPARLGYHSAKIYLSLANHPEKKRQFIDEVRKDKRLFWVGVAEGAWNAGLTFFVKSNEEFFNLKNELFSKYKDLILESHTASLVSVHYCDKLFLVDSKNTTKWRTLFLEIEQQKIDNLSVKILKELFLNSRARLSYLAKKFSVSIDVIRTRIRKLEKKKIITRYTIDIDYQALGYEFYKTFLYFRNLTQKDLHALMEFTRKIPGTIHVVKQISPWDIELETMCKSYKEYNEILASITKKFAHIISKTETGILIEDHIYPAKKMVFEE